MHDTIGFAIVGCGMIARFHVRALAEIPEARVIALVGRTSDEPLKLAAEMGLNETVIHTQLSSALKQPDVEAVIICTPSGAHLEPALAAARAGKHVIVEKPLEITPDRCDQMINACDQAGVKLCTIFPSRFADAYIQLKSAMEAGRFGRLVLAAITCNWWRSQEYYDSGRWRGTWLLDGGGALMNQAIHNVDLLCWLMGQVNEVTCFTATLAHERIEVEDTAVASLRFANGAVGAITATTGAYPGLPKTMAIHGDRGSAIVQHEEITSWNFADRQPEDNEVARRMTNLSLDQAGAADPKSISHKGHGRQLRDFIDAVQNNRTPLIDGREGRKAVELICAMYESSRDGKSIRLL